MVQAQHEHSTVGSEPGIDSNESMIAVAADALSPALTPLQLLDINKIAAGYQKEGDCVRAVAAYRVLFDKARYRRVKDPSVSGRREALPGRSHSRLPRRSSSPSFVLPRPRAITPTTHERSRHLSRHRTQEEQFDAPRALRVPRELRVGVPQTGHVP